MAPPTDRGPRPQKYNDIGNEGRITGVRPPSNVPRDSAGNERPSAYFNDDDEQDDQDEQGDTQPSRRNASQSSSRKLNGTAAASQLNGQGGKRSRPDLYAELGERGRKTGVQVAPIERDDEGYEGVSNFFHSSPAANTTAGTSSPNRTAKKSAAKKRLFAPPPPEEEEEEEYEDDDPHAGVEFGGGGDEDEGDWSADMQVDDGSSLTPSSYQRTNAHARPHVPSALRHSTTHTNGAASPSEEEDSEEESESVRRIVGASLKGSARKAGGGGLTMLGASAGKGKGRKQAVVGSSSEGEESEEEVEVLRVPSAKGKGKSKAVARVSGASTSSNRSSRRESGTPLVRLGQSGREVKVAAKGKGKGRAVESEPEEEEEEYFGDDAAAEESFEGGDGGMEVDQEEEEEEEEEPQPKRGGKGKGKGTATRVSNASSAATASPPKKRAPAKKGKETKSKTTTTTTTSAAQRQKRQREERESESVDEDGQPTKRRSHRNRNAPVAYWRNERIVYKRRASGMVVDHIVHVPQEPVHLPKKSAGKRAGSAKVKHEQGGAAGGYGGPPPEEGIDDATDPDGIVWSWEGNAEVSRRIAFTAKMVDPRPTYNNKFMFQKIYTELDYLAGGILQIPANAAKPPKPAKDNSYMFYCIEGSVSVMVHRTRFAIGPGGTFFVPRGNTYSITATSNRDVKLFFTQGRRVIELEDGSTEPDTLEGSRRVSMSQRREEEEEVGSGSEVGSEQGSEEGEAAY